MQAAKKELDKLPKKEQKRLIERFRQLEDEPRPPQATKLEYFIPTYRLRQGNYRIVYQIEDKLLKVLVVKIEARGSVYGKKSMRSVKARSKK